MLVKHLFEFYDMIVTENQEGFAIHMERGMMMYMYQRLRDMREDSDKKQEDIAQVLNITRQQYQLYESGKRELPMHHFVVLARYYNVSLDYLAGITDQPRRLR